MKRIAFLLVAVATVAAVTASMVTSIYAVTMPSGYRDWQLISVTHKGGDFNQLRAALGNPIATTAHREGKLSCHNLHAFG